jgi:hypothetical protein
MPINPSQVGQALSGEVATTAVPLAVPAWQSKLNEKLSDLQARLAARDKRFNDRRTDIQGISELPKADRREERNELFDRFRSEDGERLEARRDAGSSMLDSRLAQKSEMLALQEERARRMLEENNNQDKYDRRIAGIADRRSELLERIADRRANIQSRYQEAMDRVANRRYGNRLGEMSREDGFARINSNRDDRLADYRDTLGDLNTELDERKARLDGRLTDGLDQAKYNQRIERIAAERSAAQQRHDALASWARSRRDSRVVDLQQPTGLNPPPVG